MTAGRQLKPIVADFDNERWLKRLHKKVAGGVGTTARVSANMRRAPQAVFKIVRTGGCFTRSEIKAQMNYVLGKADHIIDPRHRHDGGRELTTQQVARLSKEWSEQWRGKIDNGNTMHLVMSFPKGADLEKCATIVRGVTEDVIGQGYDRFKYIAAIHADREHPHAHIIVERRNELNELFYFAKDGEFTYDRFKDSMVEWGREVGIEMVNTSRFSRGLAEAAANDHDNARTLRGVLVDHGVAPYQNAPEAAPSYFVQIETEDGTKTRWGASLRQAMEAAGVERGDAMALTNHGKEVVSFTNKAGEEVNFTRTLWEAKPEGMARDTGFPRHEEAIDYAGRAIAAYVETYRRSSSIAQSMGYPALAIALDAASRTLAEGRALPTGAMNMTEEDLEERFTKRVAEEVAALKALGYDKAAISEQGPEITERVRETLTLSDEDLKIRAEQAQFAERLDAMRDELVELDRMVKEAPPELRPALDEQLNAILKSVQELQPLAEQTHTLREAATDSIYAPESARDIGPAVKDGASADLKDALRGSGIDAGEVAARLQITAQNAALEAQWVERDIRSVATAEGYDMTTDAGRVKAQEKTIEYYNKVEIALATQLDRGADLDQVERAREQAAALEEAKTLAAKTTPLTQEQAERLKESVEKALGPEKIAAMERGEAVAIPGLSDIKRHDFAVAYLEAREQFGENHRDAKHAHHGQAVMLEQEAKREQRGHEQRGLDWD